MRDHTGMSTQRNLDNWSPVPVPPRGTGATYEISTFPPRAESTFTRSMSRCAGCGRNEQGQQQMEEARFGTYTRELKGAAEWFSRNQTLDLAIEATGPYGRPVWNVLEAAGLRLTIPLANCSSAKARMTALLRKLDCQGRQLWPKQFSCKWFCCKFFRLSKI